MPTAPEPLPTEISTPRLTPRCWRAADAEALGAAITASIEHLRPWMPWVQFEPMDTAARRDLIATWEAERLAGGDAVYGVFLGDVAIGGTGLHRRIGPEGLEIGYWIHVDHLGRGYATELARTLTDVALAQPGVTHVEIHHDTANVASGRVPARIGYTKVAELPRDITAPGEAGITAEWRLTAHEWPSPNASAE